MISPPKSTPTRISAITRRLHRKKGQSRGVARYQADGPLFPYASAPHAEPTPAVDAGLKVTRGRPRTSRTHVPGLSDETAIPWARSPSRAARAVPRRSGPQQRLLPGARRRRKQLLDEQVAGDARARRDHLPVIHPCRERGGPGSGVGAAELVDQPQLLCRASTPDTPLTDFVHGFRCHVATASDNVEETFIAPFD